MRCWSVVLLCAIGAALAAAAQRAAVPGPRGALVPATRRTRALGGADVWQNLIAEYTRRGAAGPGGPGGAGGAAGLWSASGLPPVIPVQIPQQSGDSERSTSVLVVPVPVPVPSDQCANTAYYNADNAQPNFPQYPWSKQWLPSSSLSQWLLPLAPPTFPSAGAPDSSPASSTLPATAAATQAPATTAVTPAPATEPATAPPRALQTASVDSKLLLKQFLEEGIAKDPSLPPIVINPFRPIGDEVREPAPEPPRAPPGSPELRLICLRPWKQDAEPEAPPRPRFERSLFLRARLKVPRADYVEKYSLWWDAASGAARADFHDGASSAYRVVKPDGRVQHVLIRQDRTGAAAVRRCAVTTPRHASAAERRLPALPDLRNFVFDGYVRGGGRGRAERWRHTLRSSSGKLGGARGEALTFRHQLVLTRVNSAAIPLWYSVRVDSSALGAATDGYTHFFDEVEPRNLTSDHASSIFSLDFADACDHIEVTDLVESVDPLREFTLLRRDPRYDTLFEQFKRKYRRTYADDLEEAIRKNLLIQTSRYVESANRQGASYTCDINFSAERTGLERRLMMGAEYEEGAELGNAFPYSASDLESYRDRLPLEWDWRQRGAVTPVRDQNPGCASCWAFATVGAVEGALFLQTSRLVPLSEQALVDCADEFGGHGCGGTWPSVAFNYTKHRGLPPLDEYTYEAKKLGCRAAQTSPVTRISGYYQVTERNITALKVAIRYHGPTVVIINAQHMDHNYARGFYDNKKCKSDPLTHAMLAVGWTQHDGETFFIIKNSWGADWGRAGYVYMRAATDACGLLRMAAVPRLRAADVLRVPPAALLGLHL